MRSNRRICVYCGSSTGKKSSYAEAAKALAKELVKNGSDLVYGGANIGLMGILANEVLALDGQAYGVIPDHLASFEIAHTELTELFVCNDMHERKKKMSQLSDGFIAMPEGLGTLEELFEIWTWAQLGIHEKPIGLFNVEGYFDPLISFINISVSEGFVKPGHISSIIIEEEPGELVKALTNGKYETIRKISH